MKNFELAYVWTFPLLWIFLFPDWFLWFPIATTLKEAKKFCFSRDFRVAAILTANSYVNSSLSLNTSWLENKLSSANIFVLLWTYITWLNDFLLHQLPAWVYGVLYSRTLVFLLPLCGNQMIYASESFIVIAKLP